MKSARISWTLVYIFNVTTWLVIAYWGMDKKQLIRDATPLALGASVLTSVFWMYLHLINENIIRTHKVQKVLLEALIKTLGEKENV